ncbi:MAG: type II toxin-antitoxin system Phd/YefM family antitoxin [Bacteroidetes bacterium]|nr:type II toxin-antitoxin system Phd/YefM family antitoxin [Bacteroidota bacterium]
MLYHTEYFEKNGQNFVVLPAEEFRKMQELLEDAEDVLDLETAISEEQHIPGLTLEEVKRTLNIP